MRMIQANSPATGFQLIAPEPNGDVPPHSLFPTDASGGPQPSTMALAVNHAASQGSITIGPSIAPTSYTVYRQGTPSRWLPEAARED